MRTVVVLGLLLAVLSVELCGIGLLGCGADFDAQTAFLTR